MHSTGFNTSELCCLAKLYFASLQYLPEQESSCKSSVLSKVRQWSFLLLLLVKKWTGFDIYCCLQILTVTVRSMFKDADEKRTSFNPRPYFRLFINWLLDLCSLDPVTDGANCRVHLILSVKLLLSNFILIYICFCRFSYLLQMRFTRCSLLKFLHSG